MTTVTDPIALQLERVGYAIVPGLMSQETVAAARAELGVLLDAVDWGSGFDGTRTKRACEAHTLSASHAQVRQLPQRLQELLGFNQPTSYLGFVNGRHPRDWLMNDQSR